MREMDFSEENVGNRWLGVKDFWSLMHGEVRGYIKRHLEAVLRVELSWRLGCERYQRSRDRCGYRNGSYGRDLLTTYGWIESVSVPRPRAGGVESAVLAKYRRRQGAVDRVLLEAFLLGHATRKVRQLCRRVFGAELSAQGVSNIVKKLDGEVAAFHRRRLEGRYRFVYLDGIWMTLSRPVKVKKVLLVALGVRPDGVKEVLGFQVASGESESCWWGFVLDLKERGLSGPELIITDGATGLMKAVTALYPRVPHQRCSLHKVLDLQGYLATPGHWRHLQADALHIFEATTETEARTRLKIFTARWSNREPRAVRVFHRDIDQCLVYLRFPSALHQSLRTTNPIDRYLQEIRRRTIPMRSFNNPASIERIAYGLIAYVLNHQPDMPMTQFTQNP